MRKRIVVGLVALFVLVAAGLVVGLRCRPDGLPQALAGDEASRFESAALIHTYGRPHERQRGTPRLILMSGDHSYQVMRLLQAVPAEETVELIVWRVYCLGDLRAEMSGVFDPTTGRIKIEDGQPLYDIHRQYGVHRQEP